MKVDLPLFEFRSNIMLEYKIQCCAARILRNLAIGVASSL